jgi:bifunctional non-homologous end joining protein LigD
MAGKKLKPAGLKKVPFPGNIKPMLATLTDKPFSSPEWIFEIKWDGYRVIAKRKGKTVSLTSRNLLSFDIKFAPIKKALSALEDDVVLDGEVVAVDENSKPSFQRLQNYAKTGEGNIVYYVFDVLWYKGYSTEELPVIERKELLKGLLPEMLNVYYCEHIVEDGINLFKQAKKLGLEGIIAKKADSKYYEDSRSKSWLKIKTVQAIEAIICGYTEPRGSRKYFGALILGVYEKKKLVYIGHTGTGFNYSNQKEVFNMLQKHVSPRSPFEESPKPNAPVTWLKPKLVCEIKYSEMTGDRILRHPVFMRMRDDKKPAQVTFNSQLKSK